MRGVAVFGITGRMGQSLVKALAEQRGPGALVLTGALASAGSPKLGADAAEGGPRTGVVVTADPGAALEGASVAIDFSRGGIEAHVRACAERGIPLLIGTTALEPAALMAVEVACTRIALIHAPNTSLGVAVLSRLAALADALLGGAFDVEILETHHRAKRDAPSGTALALGEVLAGARGRPLSELAALDRTVHAGTRRAGSIGFSSLRAGDVVGEHTVLFGGDGERLELTHRASDRAVFARGALAAARWLRGRPAGRYAMDDVLGLARAVP
jgi:4-hydroxy-tetrahydrodipicolinate reductase